MTKRVVIHPGFPKTGTTAIQLSLAANRAELLNHGVLYPTVSTSDANRATGQHRAAWAIKGRFWGWESAGGKQTPFKVWEKMAKKMSEYPETSLFSSEFLSELTVDEIKTLKNNISTENFHVVFTIRPFVKMLPSQYQQSLKYGMRLSYEDWLQRILNGDASTVQNRNFWIRHDHAGVIQRWVEIFGAENVEVVIVDETQPNLIYETFTRILNLPSDLLKPVEEKGLNRSLTWEEICLLLEMNNRFDRSLGWGEYALMIRNSTFRALSDAPAREGQQKLLTPKWAVDRAQEVSINNVNKIGAMGVPIVGNLNSLANVDVPTGVNDSVTQIPVDLVAEMLLTHKQATLIRSMPGEQIREEFYRRLGSRKGGILLKLLSKVLQKIAK